MEFKGTIKVHPDVYQHIKDQCMGARKTVAYGEGAYSMLPEQIAKKLIEAQCPNIRDVIKMPIDHYLIDGRGHAVGYGSIDAYGNVFAVAMSEHHIEPFGELTIHYVGSRGFFRDCIGEFPPPSGDSVKSIRELVNRAVHDGNRPYVPDEETKHLLPIEEQWEFFFRVGSSVLHNELCRVIPMLRGTGAFEWGLFVPEYVPKKEVAGWHFVDKYYPNLTKSEHQFLLHYFNDGRTLKNSQLPSYEVRVIKAREYLDALDIAIIKLNQSAHVF